MDLTGIETKLNELVKEVGGMEKPDSEKFTELAEKAAQGHMRLKKTVDNLQESLDYLRVCVKYQLLDLEATRRENAYLKSLLDNDQE